MFIWSNMSRVCFLFQDRNHKHADVCVYTACVQYRQEGLNTVSAEQWSVIACILLTFSILFYFYFYFFTYDGTVQYLIWTRKGCVSDLGTAPCTMC
ncbi:hypothetical protein BDV34DRAFT_157186 [Aspergillus parasiticus]|uniref:Uncharacterized protein n=1 Tax=Aspergillus parasiticus TaxID=5067 RepID=A0A5N6DAY9_ASPPA|nr:hypothetical protein BDV34DRAFT_157186 [Aspergillus parasiticus]